MKRYDLVVIGSGPAGEKAAVKAAYFGYQVAIIEKEDRFGGAGVQTGTLPSKTLKETALYFSRVYEKGIYSMDTAFSRSAGVKDFLYRKDQVTQEFGREVEENLKRHQVDIFMGQASFVDDHRILISGEKNIEIYGDYIIVATGSYPVHPEFIPPFDGKRIHDSDTILELEEFPESMCILGAGVIGCEYATIFANMGVRIYIVNNRDKILGFLDAEVSEALVEVMKSLDIEILFDNSIDEFDMPEHEGDQMNIRLKDGTRLSVDMFLFAAGRNGNLSGLKPEVAGLETGPRETLVVNEKFQTNVSHIYAVGDVIGFPALASTSMDQGRVAVAHIFQTKDLESLTASFPYGIYTIPEVSMVGMTEHDALASGISCCTGKCLYRNTARGRIQGIKQSWFLKLVFERESKVILGVHIIGRAATEIIHYGMALVHERKTLDEVISTVFNYPTLHDLYKYAAYDGLGNLSGRKVKQVL
jgi:NAD(P) transhydrogenase